MMSQNDRIFYCKILFCDFTNLISRKNGSILLYYKLHFVMSKSVIHKIDFRIISQIKL